ncbi:MAG: TIGR02266 family protein [Myxococcota bacterium]
MPNKEERHEPRSAVVVPVRLSFSSTEDFLRAYSENLSLGGIFVATAATVEVGTKVDLTIDLLQGKGLRVHAEVAWRREEAPGQVAGVGLRFVDMAPQYRQWLHAVQQEYLAHNSVDRKLTADHQIRAPMSGQQLTDSRFDVQRLSLSDTQAPIIGIDLGTSNSCACIYTDKGPVVLDLTEEGATDSKAIPSVVAYDDEGNVTVGHRALDGLHGNAKRTVFGSSVLSVALRPSRRATFNIALSV